MNTSREFVVIRADDGVSLYITYFLLHLSLCCVCVKDKLEGKLINKLTTLRILPSGHVWKRLYSLITWFAVREEMFFTFIIEV